MLRPLVGKVGMTTERKANFFMAVFKHIFIQANLNNQKQSEWDKK